MLQIKRRQCHILLNFLMKHLGKDNDDIMRAGNPCWESVQKKKKKTDGL